MSLPPLLWNAAFPSFFTWLRVAGSLIVLLLASLLTGCGKQDAALVGECLVNAAGGQFHGGRQVGNGGSMIATRRKHRDGAVQRPIDVEFAVPQVHLPELQQRINQNAVLPAIALDRTRTQTLAEGRFMAMDNQVDTQTGTVRAKARFTNDSAKLFPIQFVNVRLQINTI